MRAARGANLGREVGKRGDVVADQGRRVGELRAGQLHAVARVAAKAHGGGVQLATALPARRDTSTVSPVEVAISTNCSFSRVPKQVVSGSKSS